MNFYIYNHSRGTPPITLLVVGSIMSIIDPNKGSSFVLKVTIISLCPFITSTFEVLNTKPIWEPESRRIIFEPFFS